MIKTRHVLSDNDSLDRMFDGTALRSCGLGTSDTAPIRELRITDIFLYIIELLE